MTRARGFTLVEVLVAVAVLAVTLSAFIVGGSRYADNGRYLQDRTLALWVARNRMVEYHIAQEWPDTGNEEGTESMGGREWEWQARISESPDSAVRRIDIEVYRIQPGSDEAGDDSIAQLKGFITQTGNAQGPQARP